jgi:shikimate kinase
LVERRILLVGMMGAGKTTVGRLLADRLGWRYVDSDEQVVAATGRTVRDIFERDGEAAFRREEAAALAAALVDDGGPAVVSVAGGAIVDPESRRRVAAAGTVVWLRAPVDVLASRAASGSSDHRPLLGSFDRLYESREPAYAEVADVVVDVADVPPEAVVARVLDAVSSSS